MIGPGGRAWIAALSGAAILGGCSRLEVARPASERGEALFANPSLSSSSFNAFSCADCHSRSAVEGDRIYAGFPLANSAGRESWWNGYANQYLDAVNNCMVFFMRGDPIEPGDPRGDALYEYLLAISPQPTSPGIPFTVRKNIQPLPAGDAAVGALVYQRACQDCHGDTSGRGRISTSTTILNQELSDYYDERFPGIDHDLIVIEKVRHGQFFGIGGNMPLFAEERLSDEQLADLVAYLEL